MSASACLPSPVEWGAVGRGARGTAAGAGVAGLACAALCSISLYRHRRTPCVKASSRELCALLLAAAALCHVAALASALRPAPSACALARLAAPALSGVYAAVLTRTARVARLVRAASHPAARPRLLSSRAQVALWAALSAPGAAAAAWSLGRWPCGPRLLHPGRARSVLACGGSPAAAQLAPLAPALALLAACVALAVRTRRLPRALNETRWVGAATYAACVAWLAFAPLYASSAQRAALLCACASLSAGACVLLALGPRVWLCECRPQRNTRAHFLTATEIRCHLGRYRPERAAGGRAGGAAGGAAGSRDAGCQAGGAQGAGERCARAGACARVTCTTRESDDVADVLIVLLHHQHVTPDE